MNIFAKLAATALVALPSLAFAFEGPELYPGEQALYDAAQKEGLVVSFDTVPTWANWAAQFKAFKARYPGVEMVYNDLGSAVTVTALDKARNRPQADTAYYFAGSAVAAADKGLVADFKPINFDKLPEAFRQSEGQWFTIHTLNIAFIVNTKLVKDPPQSWADLLKPEYKNSVVYLDPRSTGQGQVVVLAANFAAGGDMNDVKPGLAYIEKLHKMAAALIKYETIDDSQIADIMQGRDPKPPADWEDRDLGPPPDVRPLPTRGGEGDAPSGRPAPQH